MFFFFGKLCIVIFHAQGCDRKLLACECCTSQKMGYWIFSFLKFSNSGIFRKFATYSQTLLYSSQVRMILHFLKHDFKGRSGFPLSFRCGFSLFLFFSLKFDWRPVSPILIKSVSSLKIDTTLYSRCYLFKQKTFWFKKLDPHQMISCRLWMRLRYTIELIIKKFRHYLIYENAYSEEYFLDISMWNQLHSSI